MRYFSRLPLYFLILLFITLYLGFFPAAAKADTTGFLTLINNYRQQNSLGTLVEDQNLTNAACWLSADLKNNFSHTDSQGRGVKQRLSDFGVSGVSYAENIYYTTSSSSANSAFTAWQNSAGHNTNMLNGAYTRIGIGRVYVSGKWYWTTDFANGSATTMTSQCGTATNPPPTQPNPPAVKKTTPPPPAPATPVTIVETPVTEVVIATPSATVTNTDIATKSATISAKIVKIENKQPKQNSAAESLVKGSFLTASFVGYLVLFGFMGWNLFHHFRLPPKEHG